MSKRKNTLKDLDEFLKQQAATLVAPEKLGERRDGADDPGPETSALPEISHDRILSDLKQLAKVEGDRFPSRFYDLIIGCFESRPRLTPEDRMLLNTALYLKNGPHWKSAIREFWSKKP